MTKQKCTFCHDTAPLIAHIDEQSKEIIRLKERIRRSEMWPRQGDQEDQAGDKD
jgi:hypothetical protein